MRILTKIVSLFTKRSHMKHLEQEVLNAAVGLVFGWDQYLLLEEEVGFLHQQIIDLMSNNTAMRQGGNVTLSNLTKDLNLAVTRLMGEAASLSDEYSDYLSKKFEYQRAGGSILNDYLSEAFCHSAYSSSGQIAMKSMLDVIETFRKKRETEPISEAEVRRQEVPSVNLGVY